MLGAALGHRVAILMFDKTNGVNKKHHPFIPKAEVG